MTAPAHDRSLPAAGSHRITPRFRIASELQGSGSCRSSRCTGRSATLTDTHEAVHTFDGVQVLAVEHEVPNVLVAILTAVECTTGVTGTDTDQTRYARIDFTAKTVSVVP